MKLLNKDDYYKWDGNYVHNSVADMTKLTGYETIDGLPLFVSKREPDGHFGYCDADGNEFQVCWKDDKLKEENEKLKAEIEKLKESEEEINKLTLFAQQKHTEFMELNTARIKKLEAENEKLKESERKYMVENVALKTKIDMELNREIEQLKNPVIHNRDSRCNQFDIRVGYSFVKDYLDAVLLEEELDHFDECDYQEKADFVCEEVARAIDAAINNYIPNPVGQLEYHILDYVRDKVEVLRDSGHIYEEYPVVNDDE
jgi:hypothetical protein